MVWFRPSRSRPDQGRSGEGNSGGSGGSSLPADGGAGSGGDGGTRGVGRTQQRPPSICATSATNAEIRSVPASLHWRLPRNPSFES